MSLSHKTIITSSVFLVLVFLVNPFLTSAQVSTSTKARPGVGAAANQLGLNASSTARARLSSSGTAAREKAEREIDRRITALNSLSSRVDAMVRVNSSLKETIRSNNEGQVKMLAELKNKISTQEDIETLKTDIKSVTQSYRTFALVIPQGHITAGADRIANITVVMQNIVAKLQVRVDALTASGVDTTSAIASLKKVSDNSKLAQGNALSAVQAVMPLTPDNGDAAKKESNSAAVKAAQKDIKAANKIITESRLELNKLIKFVGGKQSTSTTTSQ